MLICVQVSRPSSRERTSRGSAGAWRRTGDGDREQAHQLLVDYVSLSNELITDLAAALSIAEPMAPATRSGGRPIVQVAEFPHTPGRRWGELREQTSPPKDAIVAIPHRRVR